MKKEAIFTSSLLSVKSNLTNFVLMVRYISQLK